MANNYDDYVRKYHNKGLLIDTNLLLMLFIGSIMDVSKFKRTKKGFKQSHYDLLLAFTLKFKYIITTPNILTEVSNLAGNSNIYGKIRTDFFQEFTNHLTIYPEKYIKSQSIPEEIIHKYGLTDAGIIHLVKDKYLLLTDDFPLKGFAEKKNIDVINFTNIRYLK